MSANMYLEHYLDSKWRSYLARHFVSFVVTASVFIYSESRNVILSLSRT